MSRSRATLATTEAAATRRLLPSPLMTGIMRPSHWKSSRPSTRTRSGRGRSASTARCMLMSVAWRMLWRSMAAGWPKEIRTASALATISANNSSRSSSSICLESFTRKSGDSSRRTTAAHTTGPASAPRPASSTPAITEKPCVSNSRSKAQSFLKRRRSVASARFFAGVSCVRPADTGSALSRGLLAAGRLSFALFLLLLDSGGFANAFPQVVELGTTNTTLAQHFDLGDVRRMQREHALDTDAGADLANGERLTDAFSVLLDDGALERLFALLVAFDNPHHDLDGVAHLKVVGLL